MKTKIVIFILLNIFGFILATLGNTSSPFFYGTTYFWPAAVIEAIGGILFGWTGVLAGVSFTLVANWIVMSGPSSLYFVIPSFLECYLPWYLFRKFNCEINLKGTKNIVLFSLAASIIPFLTSGLLASMILTYIGKITTVGLFIWTVIFGWFINSSPWIIIFGLPLVRVFAPILKEYGFLFGQPQINRTFINENVVKRKRVKIVDFPIFLKIFSSLLIIGILPITILGTYDVIANKANVLVFNHYSIFICSAFFGTLMLTGKLTTTLISPIKKLSHAIERIMKGEFNYEINIASNDELGQLADTFNEMSRTVKENIQQKEMYMQKVSEQERLAAIGRTTSLVAHDVRKPFTMLKTMLQLFPSLTPKQIKKYSEDLDISIRKVEAMLSDIMEVSREIEYELAPGNILSVLDLAIKDVSRYHPDKNIDFYYKLDAVALIDLDEQRICRALENIIDNAFGFVPDKGGFMWFSTKKEIPKGIDTSGDHMANLGLNNRINSQKLDSFKYKRTKIVIGNSHSHIPEDQIKKVFQDRFTSGKKGGTGLGLSIVSKVINGHKGSVIARNVEKAPEFVPKGIRNIQGVEFEIILPLTNEPGHKLKDPFLKNSEEAKAALGMVEKANQFAGSSEIDTLIKNLESLKQKPSLLILDDESIYRMRVRDVLGNLGELSKLINVYDAASYNGAVELLGHTKIDYLVCDIDLSDKDKTGFSVLSKAKQKYPNCKVLMHTNRKDPEDIEQANSLGACGFCPKPITEAILVDLLLDKELWPNDFRKKQPEISKENTAEYVEAIPNSTILIVNDDPLALELSLTMIESHVNPKDNISLLTASSYAETKNIIDDKTPDILIADYNLESPETGVDICRYMKDKSAESACIIYSGMSGKELKELKEENKDCVDEAFSNSCNIKDMLNTAFNLLKNLRGSVPPCEKKKGITHTEETQGKELLLDTISTLYAPLDEITSQIAKAPESLDDLKKLKTELAPVIKAMTFIGNIHDAIIDHLEDNKDIPAELVSNIKKIEQLLSKSAIRSPQSEILKILHLLRHDITGGIILVKNFFLEVETFAKKMGDEIKPFTQENIIKLQGLNEAVTAVKNGLNDGSLKPKIEDIKPIIKSIRKESTNKILSLRKWNADDADLTDFRR